MPRCCALLVALLTFTQTSAANKSTTSRVRCVSGLRGDFGYKTCAAFCKTTSSATHCKYCKCMGCSFCGGESAPASVVGGKPPKAKKKKRSRSPPPPRTEGDGASLAAASQLTSPPDPMAASAAAQHQPAAALQTQQQLRPEQPQLPQSAATGAPPAPSESSFLANAIFVVVGAAGCLYCATAHTRCPPPMVRSLLRGGRGGDGADDDDDDDDGSEVENGSKAAATNGHGGSAAAASASPASWQEYRVRALCVCFLCVQYATYALLRRYATGVLHEEWSLASVLGMAELLKFGVSASAIGMRRGASEAPAAPIGARLQWLINHSSKMAVPAGLYLTMNMLGFVSLRRVDAGTFAIVQQSKIFFTALFARLMLGRTLSAPKWATLTILVLAVSLLSLLARPSMPCAAAAAGGAAAPAASARGVSMDYVLGVIAVTADSALSGLATVYFEKVLKTTVLTVWDRNLQLAFWSILIYVPWMIYDHPSAPLYGWSAVTFALALLAALGGILVALVIKHADGLAKNLATASSIVLTTLAGHVLFGGPMSAEIALSSLVVIVAGYTYQKVA